MSEQEHPDDRPAESTRGRAPRIPRHRPPAEHGATDEPVEEWTLTEEITRLPFSTWRMAIVAWVDVAKGVAATAPVWLGATCAVALVAVCYLAAHAITAWPPYAAVICILLIATWAGPRTPRPARPAATPPRRLLRHSRWRRWRRLPAASPSPPGVGSEPGPEPVIG